MRNIHTAALAVFSIIALSARSAEPTRAKSPWPEPDAKEIAAIKAELQTDLSDEFNVVNVGPWVVATDLPTAESPRYVDYTIANYAAQIQRQLFSTPRSKPVKVLLFKDRLSYETWNKKLYGEKPSTPYGYYSRQRNALVMNIATGGGTLLHEMVHAMAEADFANIPSWLNEGIGSLFEASGRGPGGKVIGITNWRLNGLQKSLQNGTATKFSELLVISDNEFYGENSGTHYASARYLMQWLQEQGKLEAFYTRIRDKTDKDAPATLCAVFDNKLTLQQIEERCYAWVKTLSPPAY